MEEIGVGEEIVGKCHIYYVVSTPEAIEHEGTDGENTRRSPYF